MRDLFERIISGLIWNVQQRYINWYYKDWCHVCEWCRVVGKWGDWRRHEGRFIWFCSLRCLAAWCGRKVRHTMAMMAKEQFDKGFVESGTEYERKR